MTGLFLAAVLATNVTWHDAARNRDIPARIYAPEKVSNTAPLLVFSHGLGGTREAYAYLAGHWAGNGYICVVVQHAGSDDTAWRGQDEKLTSMRRAASLENARQRPLDISFAITQMLRDRRVDARAIGVAGHSFGAHTALLIAGQLLGGQSYRDARVKAVIAMSSSPPKAAGALRGVETPCLHLTGTDDDSRLFNIAAKDRRYAYDHIGAAGQWLITLKGATHMTFAGRGEPQHLETIRRLTCAFWDIHLKSDASATNVLLNADAAVEHK
jgi:predicted dienelactone hydrolase